MKKKQNKKTGKVYIVGAGPMNAGLLTLEALECIKRADMIFYDRLIDDSILKYRGRGVPVFFVGKSRERTFSQKEINRLLVSRALKGMTVVRLKGGDPFLFGRGAEEALSLKEAGIDFEVINGVSSSFAAPAFAGIPLTLRNVSSAVTIVTGQEDPYKKFTAVDWSRAWSRHHTLVILMGMKNLPNIVKKLKELGVPSATPVAIIQEGATVRQKVVQSSLDAIVEKVKKTKIKAPAVIVIGDVVRARSDLCTRRARPLPLKGRNILMAATRDSFYKMKEIIEPEGCFLRHFEGVTVSLPASFKTVDSTLEKISEFQWLVFTSKNAVSLLMERLKILGFDIRILSGVKIAAIGPGTAEQLRAFFLEPALIPGDFSSRGLINAFSAIRGGREKVLLMRADKAGSLLPDALTEMGFAVKDTALYRLRRRAFTARDFREIMDEGMDMIVFASSENARSFFSCAGRFGCLDKLRSIPLMGMGLPTQETVREYGFSCAIPRQFTFASLAQAIKKELKQ